MKQKQKMMGIGIGIMIIGVIFYYLCNKEKNSPLGEVISYEDGIENITNEEAEEEVSQVTVYITGAVNVPGVYTLKQGSRIGDAVEQAQGLREDANAEEINLAYIMEDGMQIIIPSTKESNKEQKEYISTDSEISTKNTQGTNAETSARKVNINTATQEQLETLTGIGPSTAAKIIQYRKENGNFKVIEDIKKVNGIGDNKYNRIKDNICVK